MLRYLRMVPQKIGTYLAANGSMIETIFEILTIF